MYKKLRIIFILLFLSLICFSWAHAYDSSRDSDFDGVENNLDACLNTPSWKVADSIWCTQEQRQVITFSVIPTGTNIGKENKVFDFENKDIDFDGISNSDEALGYTGTLSLSGNYFTTNPYDPDSDDDGLNDGSEKTFGTNPLKSDTDGDWIGDDADQEKLTSPENRRYVNAVWVFDEQVFQNRDDDKDGIKDALEPEGCQFSRTWEVYKEVWEYYGCTPQQKISLLQLISAKNRFAALTASVSDEEKAEAQQQVDIAQQKVYNVRSSWFDALRAGTSSDITDSLNIKSDARNGVTRDGYIETFKRGFGSYFFGWDLTGEKGAKYLMLTIARDIKNLVVLLAIVYLFILAMKLIFSGGSEEDMKKWRMGIVYVALGIVVMQISYVLIATLYDQRVNGATAQNFMEKIVYPFIRLLELLASFAFLAMAFYAFYQIITAGWSDEKAKQGKQTIIFALVGFLLLKVPRVLVESIYGKAECTSTILGLCMVTVSDPNLSATVQIMTKLINYFNGFIGIITVLLIIYAGFLVITSGGDEEKVKKAKSIITYAIIGIILLVASYALFNFFVASGKAPIPGA